MEDEKRVGMVGEAKRKAGMDASTVPFDYSGSEFAPIEGASGLRDYRAGGFNQPAYYKSAAQNMAELDPDQASKYQDMYKKMLTEGVFDTAAMLKMGRIKDASSVYLSTGDDTDHAGFIQDTRNPSVFYNVTRDGRKEPINVEQILSFKERMAGKSPRENYHVGENGVFDYSKGRFLNDKESGFVPRKKGMVGQAGEDGGGGGIGKPGVYMTRTGVPIKHEQLVAQYKVEHNFPDEMELAFMEPQQKAQIMQRMQNAKPIAEWAAERFGVNMTGMQEQSASAPKQGKDGNFYIPDPARPGKFLRVDPGQRSAMEPPRRPLVTREQRQAQAVRGSVPTSPQANRMASEFGMAHSATLGERGESYNEMAMAATNVEKNLRQGLLPDENDLFEALQFALGKGDQAKAQQYQQILEDNYGVR